MTQTHSASTGQQARRTATRTYYNEQLAYTTDVSSMRAVEPSLLWTTSPLDGSTASQAIRIQVYADASAGPDQVVVVVGRSAQGRCFYLRDVMGGTGAGTYYDRDVSGAAQCPDIDPAAITGTGWS
jgi:hypothetical protein